MTDELPEQLAPGTYRRVNGELDFTPERTYLTGGASKVGDELRWDGEHAPARPPKANMSASAQHSVVDEVVFGRDYDYSKLDARQRQRAIDGGMKASRRKEVPGKSPTASTINEVAMQWNPAEPTGRRSP